MNLVRKLLLQRKDRRPPFLKAPLNAPGASLKDQLDDKIESFAFGLFFGPAAFLLMLSLRPMMKSEPSVYMFCGLIILCWLGWLLIRGKRLQEEVRTTRLGYLGEVLVGQELERTRAFGCSVYHDIINNKPKFNIDHISIGQMGVMVFETKARSKPVSGDTKIRYDNGRLSFSNGPDSTKELDQAKRNMKYMQTLLLKLINDSNKVSLRKFNEKNPVPMQTCLVFPGWHVDYNSARGSGVNLSNDKMLFNFLSAVSRKDPVLSSKEASDLNELLDAHLRSKKQHLIEV